MERTLTVGCVAAAGCNLIECSLTHGRVAVAENTAEGTNNRNLDHKTGATFGIQNTATGFIGKVLFLPVWYWFHCKQQTRPDASGSRAAALVFVI